MTIRQAGLLGTVASWCVRLVIATLRIRVDDRAGVLGTREPRVVWLFWHNRLFIIPHLLNRYLPGRPGAALTSASKDGEILAAFLGCFGIKAIRGSSSRRGATAMRELIRIMADGHDAAITPDGPRGPCYEMNPGVLILAQKARVPVMPIRVRYSRYWEFKSWDRFQVPKPFARVDITLLPLEAIPETLDDAAFERERLLLETVLRDEQG